MYSFLIDGKDKPVEKHRAKGIKRGAAREIRHENYKEQLNRPAENYLANHRIGNKLHRLYTIEVFLLERNFQFPLSPASYLHFIRELYTHICLLQTKKRGLCAFDDKRFLLADGVHTLAFGHHSVPAVVRTVEAPTGAAGSDRVLSAVEAHIRPIPPRRVEHLPIGQEPGACFREARRVMHASLSGGPVQSTISNAAAAASTSDVAVPPEELFEFINDDSI